MESSPILLKSAVIIGWDKDEEDESLGVSAWERGHGEHNVPND